jgi:hypothetical protein
MGIMVVGIMGVPTADMVEWMTPRRKVGPAAEDFRLLLLNVGLEPDRTGVLQASVGLARQRFRGCLSTAKIAAKIILGSNA